MFLASLCYYAVCKVQLICLARPSIPRKKEIPQIRRYRRITQHLKTFSVSPIYYSHILDLECVVVAPIKSNFIICLAQTTGMGLCFMQVVFINHI